MAERVARSHGLDVFDVMFRRESGGWVLRVVIDRPAGTGAANHAAAALEAVGVADCQLVSSDLGTLLDVEDPIDRGYTLEVSSPGLDRPLRQLDDFRRFTGRLAKIVVAEPLDGQTHFEGRLEGVDGEIILMRTGPAKVVRIPAPRVKRARLEVEF